MNNLTNLLNCKQEIRQHPRLFLSDNDDSAVLPDQLRPNSTNEGFIIHIYAKGRATSAFHPAIYIIGFISLLAARLYLTSFYPSIFYPKALESAPDSKDSTPPINSLPQARDQGNDLMSPAERSLMPNL